MQKLSSTFKATRRRVFERAVQAVGIAESSSSSSEEDVQFETALKRFEATVVQIRDVEEAMKEHLLIMGAHHETQLRLAQSMDLSFRDGPLFQISATFLESQQKAYSNFSHLKTVYLHHVLHPTNELLRQSVPEIHDLLEERITLKLDCDSYTRRASTELSKACEQWSRQKHIPRVLDLFEHSRSVFWFFSIDVDILFRASGRRTRTPRQRASW
jgi:alkaline phosphatase